MKRHYYTEKFHAKRVIGVLEAGDTCHMCPAMQRFRIGSKVTERARPTLKSKRDYYNRHIKASVCEMCGSFVGAWRGGCPCLTMGPDRAVKAAWLALEEKGYLNGR
jgi:hypothetical protein